jgi:hypothetical protein
MSANTRLIKIRVVAALMLAAMSLLAAGCSLISGETKIDEGIVIAQKEMIRSSTAIAARNLAEVKRGDPLDILEQQQVKTPTRIEEWYRVRTKSQQSVEGWIQARFVINKPVVDKMQALFEKSKAIPSQGTGRLKVQTRLRAEPDGDVVTYLSRGTMVEIVGKTRTTFKPQKQQDDEDSDETLAEPETRTVLWYQVRLPEGEVLRAGWIGAQQVQLDVPEDIIHLEGEGRVFTGWVVFDHVKDKQGNLKNNYIATMKRLDMEGPIDFTRLWVLVFNPQYGRYVSAPISGGIVEDGLRGVLPITLTTSSERRGFTTHELDESDKPIPIEYEIVRAGLSYQIKRISPKIQIKKPPAKPKSSPR